jgi:hypothetical protein
MKNDNLRGYFMKINEEDIEIIEDLDDMGNKSFAFIAEYGELDFHLNSEGTKISYMSVYPPNDYDDTTPCEIWLVDEFVELVNYSYDYVKQQLKK